jgi:tetratricopeptide (TPR) repeat protein
MQIDFSGARRVPLVGRNELLAEVEQRIRRGGVHLLCFEGEGGIGKTALLEAALARCRDITGASYAERVAGEAIDLYHTEVHTPEGLIRRILYLLGDRFFRQTTRILEQIDRARGVGNLEVANEKTRLLFESFPQEFMAMAEEGTVVLALDTLEVLEYEHDSFQEALGELVPIVGAGEWIFRTFFPALRGNVLILLAGRPTGLRARLEEVRAQNPYLQLCYQTLQALGEAETREYLKAVSAAESQMGDEDAAARLWHFGEERSDLVHCLTGGRPILLALVADMVAEGWALPPAFGRTLAELQQRGAAAWQEEVEWALVVRIQESPTPIGETIRALAWLRKGATAELLARVMDLVRPDGQWDLDTAQKYLEQVACLTLIKIRPGDRRVFLHDEMYTLLDRHVLRASTAEEVDRVFETVVQYCQEQIQDLEDQVEQASTLSPLLSGRLREAFVEELHYRLRHRPPLGFATYFWRIEQALDAGDTELDMLLRTELLRTTAVLKRHGTLGGLDPREIEMDTGVRWGMRVLFFRNDSAGALAIFDQVEALWKKDAEDLEVSWAHLLLYRAVAHILRGEENDWLAARQLLGQVESRAKEMVQEAALAPAAKGLFRWVRSQQSPPEISVLEGQRWRARILQAATLNYQGYLDRQLGRYTEAVKHYQESAMLQRRLEMAGLAPVLINLSYAMSLTGQIRRARLLAEEAERWARRSGRDYILALALNARALVETYDNQHREALRLTDRALEVATGLRVQRVHGLIYLTRARAYRYLFGSLAEEPVAHDLELLDKALKEANLAVNLLRNSPPDRVAALIERGCMQREIARGYYLRDQQLEAVKSARESRRDLERAAALGGAMGLPDQQALAWISLAWLWYYAGQMDEAAAALAKMQDSIPGDYLVSRPGPLPEMAEERRKGEARLPFWSTLGQAEMLRAYMALDQFGAGLDADGQKPRLRGAVRHITLGLAYYELIADEYFDIIVAEEGLHRRILLDELSIGDLHRDAQEVAQNLELRQPTRFQEFLTRMFGPADLWR